MMAYKIKFNKNSVTRISPNHSPLSTAIVPLK